MGHLNEYKLIDYLGGDCTENEQTSIEKHLNDCWECRGKLDELRGDLEDITKVYPEEPGELFWVNYPVKLKERMDGAVQFTQKGYFRQWATALAGAAFAAALIFTLFINAGMNSIPLSFEEWSSYSLYTPVDFEALDEGMVNSALGTTVDIQNIDFLPVNESDLTDMMNDMSAEELEKVFDYIKKMEI